MKKSLAHTLSHRLTGSACSRVGRSSYNSPDTCKSCYLILNLNFKSKLPWNSSLSLVATTVQHTTVHNNMIQLQDLQTEKSGTTSC